MRLLVVRCLAFAVVQALMRARGNAGASGKEGRSQSRLRFDCQRSKCSGARSVCSGTWEGKTSAVLSGALCSTGAASSALKWERDSAGAFAGARYVALY